MFYGSEITNVMQMNAKTMSEGCCKNMYANTKVNQWPEWLVSDKITLAEYCFNNMFGGCQNLQEVVINTTQTLPNGCFANMFGGCSSLKRIEYGCSSLGPDTNYNWVKDVANTGVWKNLTRENYNTYGDSYIPTNWQIIEWVPYPPESDFCISNMSKNQIILDLINNQDPEWNNRQKDYYCLNIYFSNSKQEIYSKGSVVNINIPPYEYITLTKI